MTDVGDSRRRRWSEEETILALYLYFQLPFGQLHSGTPEIQRLALALGRSSSSVAMKLSNFASLDPKIRESGRKGLTGASRLDRTAYAQFANDWSGLVDEADDIWKLKVDSRDALETKLKENRSDFHLEPYEGESTTQVLVFQRVGQGFFRRAVLANFEETCCISGIADTRLLIASHIKPWSNDPTNRHNPTNGLLLSATFDRAFDRGLITIDNDRRVRISSQLRKSPSVATREFFARYDLAPIRSATRFDPDPSLLEWHNRNCFVDSSSSL